MSKDLNDLVLIVEQTVEFMGKALMEAGYDHNDPANLAALMGILSSFVTAIDAIDIVSDTEDSKYD